MKGDTFVPLAVTDRSGHDESYHFGALVLLEADGSIGLSVGDPNVEIYPRSSLKPLQAWAMLQMGLDLPDELLALVCASHDGRAQHLDGVRRILHGVGLTESALANTPDLPLASDEAEAVLAHGGTRSSIQQNCSGKHAGMLATCVAAGFPTDRTYLDSAHPLQSGITRGMSTLIAHDVVHVGVDGCGAPTHVLTLVDLARAFRALVTGPGGADGVRIHRAMSSNPAMVGGPGHTTTQMMAGIAGLMMKDGAEGVLAGVLADGRALALKVADGGNRVRPVIARAALTALGVDVSGVPSHVFEPEILGHGRRVGGIRCVGELADVMARRTPSH